jgi:hypothetical protein
MEIVIDAIDAWGKGHSGVLLVLAIAAYLDLSARLRFLEWVIKKRKILQIGPLSMRERWLPWTSLIRYLRKHRTVAIANGKGRISEANVSDHLKDRRKP